MRIRVRSLRQIIKEQLGLLVEAPCTSCGNPNAYIGFNSCECPNPKCRFFSQRQADDVRPKATVKKKPNLHHCGSPLSPDGHCQKCDVCPDCGGSEGTEPCETCGYEPDENCPDCGNPAWTDHDPQCSEWHCPVCDARRDDPHMKGCDWRCPICDCTPGAGEEHMTGCDYE